LIVDCTPAELAARSSRHNAVSLALRGVEAAKAAAALGSVEGVEGVDVLGESNGTARLCVRPKGGRDLAAALGARVRQSGWEVDELRLERGRLDDVFRELTAAAQAS
jgi:ABC-2 type transport system ATP-binding protein